MLVDLDKIGSFLQKSVSECVMLFGAVFPVVEPLKTFRCFLYLCEHCSLVLETFPAHVERNDTADVSFEVLICPFENSRHTDNFQPLKV